MNASAIPAHWSAVDRGPLTDDERHADPAYDEPHAYEETQP